jgi:solute carrier family 26 protein
LFLSVLEGIRNNYREWKLVHFLQDLIPITQWLPHYQWRQDFVGDLISGITVAIMHIPQGKRHIQ